MAAIGPAIPWQIIEASGSPAVPPARTYSTLVSYGSSIYLFGGYGESKGRFSDVYEFDTQQRQWRLLTPTGELPKPIYLHSAVQHANSMIVFGGNNGKESNDMYTFDIPRNHWTKQSAPGMLSSALVQFPAARYGHASCVFGNNHLLIVGGCKSNNTYFKDAYSMNLDTRQWRKLDDLPLELAYHSLYTFQNQAFLFGGFNGRDYVHHIYSLDSTTGKWSILHCTGTPPPPMCGAATVLKGHELWVFGGYTARGHTNELYRLNMHTRVWTLMPTTNKPLARAYLQAAVVESTCHIFGGYDGKSCISDFRSIVLPGPPPSAAPSVPFGGAGGGGGGALVPPSPFLQSGPPRLSDPTWWLTPIPQQAAQVLQHYGAGEMLRRTQVEALMAQMGNAMRAQAAAAARSNASAASGSNGSSTHPFDTSKLDALLSLGFPRDLVLGVMTRMHAAGQSTSNVDLVVDMCIRDASSASADSDDMPGESRAQIERQNSERAELKRKVDQLMEQQEEARTCKVCFDERIDCALMPCGHLAVCTTCAESLSRKTAPCPICQREITGKLKVYWT